MPRVVMAVAGIGLLFGAVGTVRSFFKAFAADGSHTPTLMEGVVPGEVAVGDESIAGLLTTNAGNLFEAAHFWLPMEGALNRGLSDGKKRVGFLLLVEWFNVGE